MRPARTRENDFGVERFVYVGGQDIPQKTGEGV